MNEEELEEISDDIIEIVADAMEIFRLNFAINFSTGELLFYEEMRNTIFRHSKPKIRQYITNNLEIKNE